MKPRNDWIVENRRYMWDGTVYPQEADAARVAATYRAAGFDGQVMAEDGAWLVFTRREASKEPGKS